MILEALRIDYRWANRRLHAFVIQGIRATNSRKIRCMTSANTAKKLRLTKYLEKYAPHF